MSEALSLVGALHGGLGGRVALGTKREEAGEMRHRWAAAGSLPALPGPGWHCWLTVATFRGSRRLASEALEVRAVWCDLDMPEPLKHRVEKLREPESSWRSELEASRSAGRARLESFRPAPSLVVDSGRGWHGYWLLAEAVALDGGRSQGARLIVATNKRLEELLAGDAVGDLARVMRLPGTSNPKPGGGPCRIVVADGPRYRLADLVELLGVRLDAPAPAAPGPRPVRRRERLAPEAPPAAPAAPRGRGRPPVGVRLRDLQRRPPWASEALPGWARELVVGGAWRAGTRYRLATGGRPDRSRADMAAVGAMVRAGWPDERIAAAFGRGDWLIGARVRQLEALEGAARAADYLARTIRRARTTGRGEPPPSAGGRHPVACAPARAALPCVSRRTPVRAVEALPWRDLRRQESERPGGKPGPKGETAPTRATRGAP